MPRSSKSPKLRIISLCHFRWAIPILAELWRTEGSKFVTLSFLLEISRDSLKRTLMEMSAAGWIKKNPGYGHPLRPEYILTEAGREVGPACAKIVACLAEKNVADVGLQKWSIPILVALAEGATRFSEIKTALSGVTPRAITLALKDLCDVGLSERVVIDGYPPTSIYRLTGGTRLAEVAASIGR